MSRGGVPKWDGSARRDTGWIPSTILGSWVSLAGEEAVGYRRKDGIVYWKGIVQRTAAGGSVDAWTFAPAGFLPLIVGSNGRVQQSVWTNGGVQGLYIRNDGAIFLPTYAPGNGGYVFMSDIKPYPADG